VKSTPSICSHNLLLLHCTVHVHRSSGDSAKSRKAYRDFLALWKDADPDIPILKQAKAEYARLQ
jgi:hypothetical protein